MNEGKKKNQVEKTAPSYLERGDAITVLLVVVPLALVLESISSLGHTKTRSLVVLPLARVGLHHVGVQLLVLRVWGCVRRLGVVCTAPATMIWPVKER